MSYAENYLKEELGALTSYNKCRRDLVSDFYSELNDFVKSLCSSEKSKHMGEIMRLCFQKAFDAAEKEYHDTLRKKAVTASKFLLENIEKCGGRIE